MLRFGLDPRGGRHGSASDEVYSSLIERLDLAVAVTDIDGALVSCNSAFADLLGYSVDEVQQRRPSQLVHPACRSDLEQETHQLIGGDVDTVATHRRLIRKDGSVLHARIHKSVARRGSSTVIMTVFEDVTDQVWEYPGIVDEPRP